MQEETNTFSKHQKVCRSELYNSSEVDFSEEATEKKVGSLFGPQYAPPDDDFWATLGRFWSDLLRISFVI